jgi:hypothetical protein
MRLLRSDYNENNNNNNKASPKRKSCPIVRKVFSPILVVVVVGVAAAAAVVGVFTTMAGTTLLPAIPVISRARPLRQILPLNGVYVPGSTSQKKEFFIAHTDEETLDTHAGGMIGSGGTQRYSQPLVTWIQLATGHKQQ